MDFDSELEKAIERGQQRSAVRNASARREALTAEEIRNTHNQFRLHLSDHIEECLKRLANHFPGFDYEMLYGPRGWGGAVSRNDLQMGPNGKAGSFFSRIELTVRPQNEFNVVNIAGKGTIRDKEMFTWNHFEDVLECDEADFKKRIDGWILQYAEQFASQ
jgi:hypothetical protein